MPRPSRNRIVEGRGPISSWPASSGGRSSNGEMPMAGGCRSPTSGVSPPIYSVSMRRSRTSTTSTETESTTTAASRSGRAMGPLCASRRVRSGPWLWPRESRSISRTMRAANGLTWKSNGPCGTRTAPRELNRIKTGATAGVYGSASSGEVCDAGLLVSSLQSNPRVAEAWATVHGIPAEKISEFVSGLTPVVLLRDTDGHQLRVAKRRDRAPPVGAAARHFGPDRPQGHAGRPMPLWQSASPATTAARDPVVPGRGLAGVQQDLHRRGCCRRIATSSSSCWWTSSPASRSGGPPVLPVRSLLLQAPIYVVEG